MRWRNTLAILVVFLVAGASCQAAVCPLMCAIPAHACRADAQATDTGRSSEMDMSGDDCAHTMEHPDEGASVASSNCAGNCAHLAEWSSETKAQMNLGSGIGEHAVAGLDAGANDPLLPLRDILTSKSAPSVIASFAPRVVSLRI